jgi:hypothetical protein
LEGQRTIIYHNLEDPNNYLDSESDSDKEDSTPIIFKNTDADKWIPIGH